MKRTMYVLLLMGVIGILAPNVFAKDLMTTSVKPIAPVQSLEEPIPPLPADAINLLHDEGYLTKEERDFLLYSHLGGWDASEKSIIVRIIWKLGEKLARNKAAQGVVLWAFDTLIQAWLDRDPVTGGGGGCPGPCINPPMNQ